MFKKKYIFNNNTLKFDEVSYVSHYRHHIIISVILIMIGSLIGTSLTDKGEIRSISYSSLFNYSMPSKHDVILGSNEWKDSVFLDYEKRANIYLARPKFKGTPIKGAMLALAAHNAYDSTGILLPVELALAQAQWESGMGLKGRSPINNPYNVGEYDNGTVLWFDNTFDGIQAYYYLMTRNYLKCKSLDMLFKNFTNCAGHRYASAQYELHVPKQYYYIKRWINKELKKKRNDKQL